MDEDKSKEYFLRIRKDEWKYSLESGQLSWEEFDLLMWLWLKADATGRVAVNYAVIAEEMRGRFPKIKDKVSKINKLMLSLRGKQRLWFKDHPGSPSPAEVLLADYSLMPRGFKDISKHFQQSSGRAHLKSAPQNIQTPAELSENQQRSEEGLRGLNKLKNAYPIGGTGRAPHIDRDINKEREKEFLNNLNDSSNKNEDPLVERLSKKLSDIETSNPDREVKDPPS